MVFGWQVVVGPKALMHPDVEEALPGTTYNALTRRAGQPSVSHPAALWHSMQLLCCCCSCTVAYYVFCTVPLFMTPANCEKHLQFLHASQ